MNGENLSENGSDCVSDCVNVSDYVSDCVNDYESVLRVDLYGYVNVRGYGHVHHRAEID